MSNQTPARLRAWIECPKCGHIDKSTFEFRLPKYTATPMLEKVCLACERCGEHAVMYLERAVCNIH